MAIFVPCQSGWWGSICLAVKRNWVVEDHVFGFTTPTRVQHVAYFPEFLETWRNYERKAWNLGHVQRPASDYETKFVTEI